MSRLSACLNVATLKLLRIFIRFKLGFYNYLLIFDVVIDLVLGKPCEFILHLNFLLKSQV